MTRNSSPHSDDHASDEHDLGLRHDLGTMNRRRALIAVGGVGTLTALAAVGCGSDDAAAASSTTATSSIPTTVAGSDQAAACVDAAPTETAGPYPGDGSNGPNVLISSGVVRQDLTTSFGDYSGRADGVPITINITLLDLVNACAPASGFALYLWHCDREGRYSLYDDALTEQNYLRGIQIADTSGKLSFTSIFPACYSGRWPHIHLEVFESLEVAVAGDAARLTTQIAIPEATCTEVFDYDAGYSASVSNLAKVSLSSDTVFGDGWDAELASVTGTPADGLTVEITIGVAAASENSQVAPPGGGQPGGGQPGEPPPSR